MRQQAPTVRARELGLALRRAVEAAGLRGKDLARRLDFSETKISNLYMGKRPANEVDVSAILALCGIVGPARDHLLKLTRQVYEPGWWQDYDVRLPAELQTLIDYEDSVQIGRASCRERL